MLDMQNTSAVLMKKLELAFGFAQGERWYGTVVCEEVEDNIVRSGTFHGELVLISKRALPRRKVRVNSESQELTLLDLNRDGTDLSTTIPYKARVASKCRSSSIVIIQLNLSVSKPPNDRQHCGLLFKPWHGRCASDNGTELCVFVVMSLIVPVARHRIARL